MPKNHEIPPKMVSKMETILVTPTDIAKWHIPRFQRPLKENEKVRALARTISENGGVIPGVITLGHVGNAKEMFIVDGQHRCHSAKLSELPEFIADVRVCRFETMGDMSVEFVRLQQSLVMMKPDDKLRALEEGCKALKHLRNECPFIGYSQIRRPGSGIVLSASAAIRAWVAGMRDTPQIGGTSVEAAMGMVDNNDIEAAARYYKIAYTAWGSEPGSHRLWNNINIGVCAWLYRRLVMETQRGLKRYAVLSNDMFKKCLMSVGASADYYDWLSGRQLNDRDRSPCYGRLRTIFSTRLREEGSKNTTVPMPEWWSQTRERTEKQKLERASRKGQ